MGVGNKSERWQGETGKKKNNGPLPLGIISIYEQVINSLFPTKYLYLVGVFPWIKACHLDPFFFVLWIWIDHLYSYFLWRWSTCLCFDFSFHYFSSFWLSLSPLPPSNKSNPTAHVIVQSLQPPPVFRVAISFDY